MDYVPNVCSLLESMVSVARVSRPSIECISVPLEARQLYAYQPSLQEVV